MNTRLVLGALLACVNLITWLAVGVHVLTGASPGASVVATLSLALGGLAGFHSAVFAVIYSCDCRRSDLVTSMSLIALTLACGVVSGYLAHG